MRSTDNVVRLRVAAFPIGSAPARAGERFGPVLLWPGPAQYRPAWVIGDWNGAEWSDHEGWLFAPTRWAPLPAPSATG
jgi:hypothetical protein